MSKLTVILMTIGSSALILGAAALAQKKNKVIFEPKPMTPFPEQDEIMRNQMNTITELVNKNLEDLKNTMIWRKEDNEHSGTAETAETDNEVGDPERE